MPSESQKHTSGFSMVETMVALTILVIIGTAIASLVLTMIAANTSARLRNQGLGFAEEGVEQARNYFQTSGYQALNSLANNKCYSDGGLQTLINPCPTDPAASALLPPNCLQGVAASNPSFYRSVWLTQPGGTIKVRSVVTWQDRGVCRYTEIGTNFYSY